MTPTRRTVLLAGAGAAAAALTGCGAGGYRGPALDVTIAGGQRGGFYLEVARLLAREISAAEPRLRCRPKKTDGSVANIELLRDGSVEVAVSQSDVALHALKDSDLFGTPVPLRGIGRMYEDYLQLVVLEGSPLNSIADLAGRRVWSGATGSGTALFGDRLMDTVGLDAVRWIESLDEAATSLRDGRIDALLWCGGMPTPALAELNEQVGIRLLPLVEALPGLRTEHGTAVYQQVNVPAGGYGQPGTSTIGVANLLLCRPDLPDDVVAVITAVLVERATQLVPPHALGAQFLDRRTLINLLDVPMHPGAAATYRRLHD